MNKWPYIPWEVATDSQTKCNNHWNSIWLLAGSTRLLPMQRPSFHKDAWSKVAVLGHNCKCYADIWREKGMTNTPREVATDSKTKCKNHWNSIWLLAGSTRLLPMQRPSFHKGAWSNFAVLGHNCQCYADIWWEWTNGPAFLGKWPRIHKPNAIIIETAYDYWQDQPGYFQCNDPVFTKMRGQKLQY
jgi:hypothetical protein